jgi:hypothetical protein
MALVAYETVYDPRVLSGIFTLLNTSIFAESMAHIYKKSRLRWFLLHINRLFRGKSIQLVRHQIGMRSLSFSCPSLFMPF